MALSDQDKSDLRFFLGYSMRGDNPNNASKIYAHSFNPGLEDNLNHLTAAEEARVKTMLDDLREMEEEIKTARTTLNIQSAGTFKKNLSEIRDRIQLYNYTRNQLAKFLDTPILGGSVSDIMV